MFIFDVETLDTESTCVVLSAAIIHFDPEEEPSYQDLLDKALFVKFDSMEQVKKLNRTISHSTLDWWKGQHEYVRGLSFDRKETDVSAHDGIALLTKYVGKYDQNRKQTMWARGSLDQMAIDSLALSVDLERITPYNMWRDVRTAVDILYGTTNGYCEVVHPEFKRHEVIKHHPVHDCALDAMQLMYGKPTE